jgi:hypothetical protein
VSGDDVRSSNEPDAQRMLPAGAETAPRAGGNGVGDGSSDAPASDVSWVGQQHLMWGYCGRVAAGDSRPATTTAGREPQPVTRRAAPQPRPRNLVVRIGPRPPAEAAGSAAKAA